MTHARCKNCRELLVVALHDSTGLCPDVYVHAATGSSACDADTYAAWLKSTVSADYGAMAKPIIDDKDEAVE